MFGAGKLIFLIFLEQRIFESITFFLCYTFSLQFCSRKVFSLLGKTIDISYFLARNLRHSTMWHCCHKAISKRKNIFDIPQQNFKYALW